jgi:hypothetical protein
MPSDFQVFSTIKLRSSYHQLPLLAGDLMKTAFWRIDQDGKDQPYHWNFLPFGLNNAPSQFQRMMDQAVPHFPIARCYIDVVIIFKKTPHEYVRDLKVIFEQLQQWGCICTMTSASFS